ncbi:MAG: heme-binding protein [Isosphaeraceae bacterium]
MNVSIVDDGGHPIAFARMDGARPASAYTALTKATAAATTRIPTGPFPPGTTTPDLLLNISPQNAALASGGKFTALYGGVPIVIDGQVVGRGRGRRGTGEQDAEVAKAGIAALLAEIEPKLPLIGAESPSLVRNDCGGWHATQ